MKNVLNIVVYLKRVWAGVLFFTLFCSFAFQMVNGDRGYLSYKALKADRVMLTAEYDALKSDREHLEKRVKHMRPQSLDLDLLDQQVRVMLNRMEDGEFIIMK
jgi:cell division protein FtsB